MSARIIGEGLGGAARRVADHARELVRLELRLAATEIRRKIVALAAGLGLVAAAGLLVLVALLFGLAAATAALATAISAWEALLVMFGGTLLLAIVLGSVGVSFLRRGAKPVPEQAIEEARLTTEALRNGH